MRKAFNFYRSYFDVFSELGSDKEKIAFISALLDKQFLGVDPINLVGAVKMAYISQRHSIDQQVKGWEAKTGKPLNYPSVGGSVPPSVPPSVQEEGKEEGKEQEKSIDQFGTFWETYGVKKSKHKTKLLWAKMSEETKSKILAAVPAYVASTPDLKFRKHPTTYLNGRCWEDEIEIRKLTPYEEKLKTLGI